MHQVDLGDLLEVSQYIGIDHKKKVFFHDDSNDPKVYEVVNQLLEPYGFENFSENQFKRIAGGSKHSSDEIENYGTTITHGYTYLNNIVDYCLRRLNNSVFVPLERIVEEFKWARKMINEGNITLYSGGGKRYDIQAIIDITKGNLPEVALQIDAEKHGYKIELDREVYEGALNTDGGQDVKRIGHPTENLSPPSKKIQVKDVKYFLLIPEEEFYGNRKADLFVGYRAQWNKENTAQRFLRALGGRGEDVFSDYPPIEGIRVSRKGWAKREDFDSLKKGKSYKGLSFTRNDNMYVYYDNLRPLDNFFDDAIKEAF